MATTACYCYEQLRGGNARSSYTSRQLYLKLYGYGSRYKDDASVLHISTRSPIIASWSFLAHLHRDRHDFLQGSHPSHNGFYLSHFCSDDLQ